MFQSFVAVFFIGLAVVGCSIRETNQTTRHNWQRIAEVKAVDLYLSKAGNGNSFSFVIYRNGKVSFNDALILKKTIVADGPGLQIVTVQYDSSITDPHLDIVDKNGRIDESWCLKGICLPKVPRMPNMGMFVRPVNDRIMLATE